MDGKKREIPAEARHDERKLRVWVKQEILIMRKWNAERTEYEAIAVAGGDERRLMRGRGAIGKTRRKIEGMLVLRK